MFSAGYASAQERLFLMDAILRTAKGTLAGFSRIRRDKEGAHACP